MILLIQNNSTFRRQICQSLKEIELCVKQTDSFDDAKSWLETNQFSLIMLDIVVSSKSGFDLCREILNQPTPPPLIFISTSHSPADRVLGLELGAEDFISYPCHARELQARVRVQLKHQQSNYQPTAVTPPHLIQRGTLVIDSHQHSVTLNGMDIELTYTEFNLLSYLASHPNQVFNRTQLLDSVWGYQHNGYEHTVNSHVNRLRAKLHHAAPLSDFIRTIWGVGYQFRYQSGRSDAVSSGLALVSAN